MTTDYRSLCAELAQQLDDALEFTVSSETRRHMKALVASARAALAQPEPEGPTREQAVAVYSEVMATHECQTLGDMAEHFTHAVLARWGRPAIKPVPVAEPEPQRPTLADEAYVAFVQICKGNSDDADTYEADEELVRRALKRLNDLERRPTIEPVLAPPTDCSTAAIIGP